MAYSNFLAHHGIKGQKWGVRRYRNTDGTLTPEGRKRYLKESYKKYIDVDKRSKREFDEKTKEVSAKIEKLDFTHFGPEEQKLWDEYDKIKVEHDKKWNPILVKEGENFLNGYIDKYGDVPLDDIWKIENEMGGYHSTLRIGENHRIKRGKDGKDYITKASKAYKAANRKLNQLYEQMSKAQESGDWKTVEELEYQIYDLDYKMDKLQ